MQSSCYEVISNITTPRLHKRVTLCLIKNHVQEKQNFIGKNIKKLNSCKNV